MMKRSRLPIRGLAFATATALTATMAVSGTALAAGSPSPSTADDIIIYDAEVTDPYGGDIPPIITSRPRGVSSRSFLKCPVKGQVCLHTPVRLDDNNQTWATFGLWEYGTYYLSGFGYRGQSELQNNQFGNAVAITQRRDHSEIACYPPAGSHFYAVNFYPVWHVELTGYPAC
ncbi:hypothetical protein [Actinomadura sp. B10D3]|uniref:hypothetical protein n=1 Tax=Actinomadura sp. B10D3 TaxID=3153557 RepID=UPI00325DB038